MRFGLAALVLTAAAGCASEPDPILEVGIGYAAFEPVAAGTTLQLCRGPQGGQMVVLSLRAQHVEPGPVKFMLTLQETGQDEPLCGQARLQSTLTPRGGWSELCGGAFCIVPDPSVVAGKHYEIIGTLEDGAGHKLSARTAVQVAGPGSACSLPLLTCHP